MQLPYNMSMYIGVGICYKNSVETCNKYKMTHEISLT